MAKSNLVITSINTNKLIYWRCSTAKTLFVKHLVQGLNFLLSFLSLNLTCDSSIKSHDYYLRKFRSNVFQLYFITCAKLFYNSYIFSLNNLTSLYISIPSMAQILVDVFLVTFTELKNDLSSLYSCVLGIHTPTLQLLIIASYHVFW